MNKHKQISLRTVIAVMASIVLCCCVIAAIAVFVKPRNGRSLALHETPEIGTAVNSAADTTPYRNYTAVSAKLFDDGVVFYNGFSTGYGIKENLVVTGSYNGKTFVLSPDEFYVTAEGLGEIEKLDFSVNPEKLGVTVCVPVQGKTLTSSAVELTIADDLPVFETVTAVAAAVSDDNTDKTIKNSLTVTGTLADGTVIPVNRQLYSVTLPSLIAGSSAIATLTFDSEVYDKATVDVKLTDVKQSIVTGIALNLLPDLTYENGYYKKGEYSAFVDGMPFFDDNKPSVFASLVVHIFYDNSVDTAVFVGSGGTAEIVSENAALKNAMASASGSTNVGTNSVSLTVTLANGTSYTDGISVPFESKTVVDIKTEYNKPDIDVYSYTSIDDLSSYIVVTPVYNDGSVGGTISDRTLSGTLAPTSAILAAHTGEDWTYDKDITVSYETPQGRVINRALTVTGIIYKEPETWGSISAIGIPQQTMTYDFDYSGFFINVEYNDGFDTANYYLTDISYDTTAPIYKSIVYYDKSNVVIPDTADNKVPKDAAAARITVHNGSNNPSKILRFTPVQAPIDYPRPDEFEKDYSENCVITLSGINAGMTVTADGASASHVEIGSDKDGKVDIAFKSGGEFDIKVTLDEGKDGVYRFRDVIGESNIVRNDEYTVTYHFVINKGVFELSLEYGNGNDEWIYGDSPTAEPTVKATLGGRNYVLKNQDGQDGLADGEIGVPYFLYYYGFDGRTYDSISGMTYDEVVAKYSALPEDVGEYGVIVITKETDAYAQSVAYRWNAHKVKIAQKPLGLDVVKNAVYIRGTSYGADDVINTDSFVYGHSVSDVMTVTATGAPFTHADNYDISITIVNPNYKWGDGVTTVATDKTTVKTQFEIAARELDFNVSVSGFTYGDVAPDLAPVFKYRDTASGAFTENKNNFYATVCDPVYYHATSAGVKTGVAINTTAEPMNTWSAGKYIVEYATEVDTASGDRTGDYNTPTASAVFDVCRKKLSAPTFYGSDFDAAYTRVYDGAEHDINIDNYASVAAGLINGDTYDGVFDVSVEAKRTDENDGYVSSGAVVASVSRVGGTISVTEAGSYIITVGFKDTDPDYEWADGSLSDVSSDTYIVKRYALDIFGGDNSGSAWNYTFDGNAHTPVLTATGVGGHSVTLTVELSDDDGKIYTAEEVINVGKYNISVTAYSVKAADGSAIDGENYKLPVTHDFDFYITAADLKAPVFRETHTVYIGTGIDITAFISNWLTEFTIGSETKAEIAYYANGGAVGELKDVLRDADDNVTAYRVYVYPKTNYKWAPSVSTETLPSDADIMAYAIDFTVEPLSVTLDWTELEKTYNGGAQKPAVDITNKKGSDDVSVAIGFKQDGIAIAEATDAGRYIVFASALSGDQRGNYNISTVADDYAADFVINKKIINISAISLPTGEVTDFNGSEGRWSDAAAWKEFNGILSVTVSGVVPSAWFMPDAHSDLAISADGGEYSFDVTDGVFAYTRAGVYTFTVSVGGKNYCFDNDDKDKFDYSGDYTYTSRDKFTVQRKALMPKDISALRAQEWKSVTPITFDEYGEGYSVEYGDTANSVTSNSWLGGEGENGVQGLYYAEITVTGNALNYVWIKNPDDNGDLSYVNNKYADFYYTTDKVAIRLYYAITSSQIDVTIEVKDYKFGDNGYVNGVRGSFSFDDTSALGDGTDGATVYITGDGVATLEGKGISTKLTDTLFKDAFGTTVTELVNGLPWNVGVYTVTGTLVFGDGDTYQSRPVSYDFEVTAREIEIAWSDTSLEYNGGSQTPTAEITTKIQKTIDDTVDYTDGITLGIGLSDGSKPVNVETYEIFVLSLSGNDNFKLPNDSLTTEFDITAKAVTVTANSVSKHIYGDEIASAEKQSDAAEKLCDDGAGSHLIIKIIDGDGNEINRYAAVGTYTVTVEWDDKTAVYARNYDVTFVNGTFTVAKREITVEFNSANATTEYGDPVNLYDEENPIFSIIACNGISDGLAGLKVADAFVFTCAADGNAAVGVYPISTSVKDGNLQVTFVGDWKYTVTEATIINNGIVGIADTTYTAEDIDVLTAFDVTTKNEHTPPTFAYAFVDSADAKWQDVDNGAWTAFTVSPTVYDAGNYYMWVRVTADNHKPVYQLITVSVAKAELTVSLSFGIWYGEANPQDRSYKMTVSDMRTLGVYKVDGLVGDDGNKFYSADGFYGIENTDTLSYTVADFVANKCGKYDIVLDLDGLDCANYDLTVENGILIVKEIEITVDINNASVTYNSDTLPTLTYNATIPSSTYEPDKYLTLPHNISEIFSLSSDAVDKKFDLGDGITATTARVGDYPIIGRVNAGMGEIYAVEFKGDWSVDGDHKNQAGIYTVRPAAITVDIRGYSGEYDDKAHGLKVNNIETADGAEFTVTYYEVDGVVTDFDELTGGSDTMPTYTDVGVHYIVYKVTALNHDYSAACLTVDITFATNSFDIGFKFANGNQYEVYSANMDTAWVYGLFGNDKEKGLYADGYNKDGGQKVTEPESKLKRLTDSADNAFTFKLFNYGGVNAIVTADSAAALFAAAFENGLMNAGDYRIEVYMPKTDNYSALNKSWYFKVDKRDLVVSAERISVQYGDTVTGDMFVGKYEGLALNSTSADAVRDGIADAVDGTIGFSTNYTVGDEVGGYDITVSGAQSENYNVTYINAELRVTPREVTISIENKSSTYNLQNETSGQTLTFLIVGGSFYGVEHQTGKIYGNADQNIIALYTQALSNSNPSINTNNVIIENGVIGGYTIYAKYVDDFAKKNYVIYFRDCEMNETSDGVITQGNENNAGKYTINQATLKINYLGVYHKDKGKEIGTAFYSGAYNYYKAVIDDDPDINVEFEYFNEGGSDSVGTQGVTEVGRYVAYAHLDNDNYKPVSDDSQHTFEIYKTTLNIKADNTTIEYGTDLPVLSDATDRFGGFDYTESSEMQATVDGVSQSWEMLTADTLENYLIDHPVTFKSDDYSPAVNAGEMRYITPVCSGSNNVTVTVESGRMDVVQRNVTVTVVGYDDNNDAAWCYYEGDYTRTQACLAQRFAENIDKFIFVNESDTFGSSGDARKDLDVKLTLPVSAVDHNTSGYGMTVESTAKNYKINFVTSKTATGVTQNRIEWNADDAPVFMIRKAPLTLYANTKAADGKADGYSVIYGDDVPLDYSGIMKYAVDGMKNGENFLDILVKNGGGKLAYTVMCGLKSYAAWESTTQEKYTVKIFALNGGDATEFLNYEITEFVDSELTIAKLTVNATTQNVTFEKAADGYHGGVYGKAHEAPITFSDWLNRTEVQTYLPVYDLSYNTVSNSLYNQTAKAAPTRVGDYRVTVSLDASGNYTFVNGLELTLGFSVEKRSIDEADLGWHNTRVSTDAENVELENYIENYIDDIMKINSFMFYAQYGGSGKYIEMGDNGTADEYYAIDSNGRLRVYFGVAAGTYTVNFSLKDEATHNYIFISRTGTVIESSFIVTSENVTMTVYVKDFVYRETPTSPIVTINGSEAVTGVSFAYARVTDDSDIDNYIGKGDFGGFDSSDIVGLDHDAFVSSVAMFNAGYYILRAFHDSTSQTKYYVFTVERKAVDVPTVLGDVPDTYNGKTQTIEFVYDTAVVRATYSGGVVQTANGSRFDALNAKSYPISFLLVDGDNYKWASGVSANDGVYKYEWVIGKDTDDTDLADPYIKLPSLTTLTYGDVFDRGIASLRDGYVGNVAYYHIVKSDNNVPNASDTGWTSGLPSDADEYWLKAVVSDYNDNFTDKAAVAQLKIDRKRITATASGTVTYGDALESGSLSYVVDGLLYGHKVTENGYKFILENNYGKLQAGGTYYITLDTDANGIVKGLSAGNNYEIVARSGILTVNKRPVTVTIGSLSGYYTVTPDVSGVDYSVSGLADGDDRSVLGITFVTTATASSDVGGQYWINADKYTNGNYNVTNWNRGVYTVMRLAISVELAAQNGIVYGDGGIVGATIGAVNCNIAGADIDKILRDIKLSLSYSGKTFGNIPYTGTVAPAEAGVYTATLVGISDNYTLTSSASVDFTIAKYVVDVSAISALTQPYSGKALAPVIIDKVHGDGIYKVSGNTFVNAGSHDVWLELVDPNNYRWNTVDGAMTSVVFEIAKIANALDGAISIAGWQYGAYDEKINAPLAFVVSGSTVIYQYSADGVNYTTVVPETGNAGKYFVRVFAAECENYLEFISEPVSFTIARYEINTPKLTIVTSGDGKNDVYTGSDLASAIVGFDPMFMQIAYDGRINVSGNNVTVFAQDADVYSVTISLFNSRNYCWNDGDDDNDGAITLEWTIGRKKVAKPTADTSIKIVNGSAIVYIPIGFDPSIMEIDNNEYSYGGTFEAIIGLKDTKNYEWADGDDGEFGIVWTIVGADSVFTGITVALGVAAVAMAVLMLVQFMLNRKRRLETASAMQDIENVEATAQNAEQSSAVGNDRGDGEEGGIE